MKQRDSEPIFRAFPLRSRSTRLLLAATACAVLCSGCNEDRELPEQRAITSADSAIAQPPARTDTFPVRMSDVSAEAGIDAVLTSGELPSSQIIEVKGNGLALLDYNNDGMLDVFIPNGATMAAPEHGPGWRMYKNISAENELRFEDVTEAANITQTRWAFGAAVGDVDDDGWQDIFVTCYGPNVLLRNTGESRFEDATHFFQTVASDRRWSTSAAFGDVTGNGRLDLYVANYIDFDVENPPPPATFLSTEVFAGPHGLPATADELYANIDGRTFRDISQSSGIHEVSAAWGLGAVILDFDIDGRQDIYVGNDSMRNFLFHNRGQHDRELQPFLVDVGMVSGIGSSGSGANQATMGIGIADVNGNALPDVFTTNFSSDMNTLHVNVGTGLTPENIPSFEDRTNQHGLGVPSRRFLGWACGFIDLELDGQEEIVIVNGHIYPQATLALLDSEYEQPPLLFRVRPGRGVYYDRVTNVQAGAWLNEPHRDRALVFGDINRNGLIDMIIGEMNGKPRVLRNDSDAEGDWLIVELRQDGHNQRGLGSRIELFVDTALHTRWIYSGGFLSANPAEAHFGFRTGAEQRRIRVTWPDGREQWVDEVPFNQRLTVTRDQ